jgi:hypothetical protein
MDARVEATQEQLPDAQVEKAGAVARRVHARDGMHAYAGLAIEENHRKWFSSQTLSRGACGDHPVFL